MAISAIDQRCLSQTLMFVADEIARREAELNALDAAVGDGDHGITMRNGFEAIRERLGQLDPATPIDGILRESGTAFLGATGGAIGVVMGKMLMAGGKALQGVQEIRAAEFQLLLTAMEASVAATGKVKPGDRTILDAIHAAAAATTAGNSGTKDLDTTVDVAASAAEEAARGTAEMLCRVGRASRLGNRVLGHPDPGATSFAIILRATHEWIMSSAPDNQP
jgi:phosphoenolpyruvate---glycerone phosphotransferase subunit DhaL